MTSGLAGWLPTVLSLEHMFLWLLQVAGASICFLQMLRNKRAKARFFFFVGSFLIVSATCSLLRAYEGPGHDQLIVLFVFLRAVQVACGATALVGAWRIFPEEVRAEQTFRLKVFKEGQIHARDYFAQPPPRAVDVPRGGLDFDT